MPTAIPTPRQLEYQDWEFGVFLHFGIRTFYEGHRDWDGKPMPPEGFQPQALDCEQWVTTAKQAGAKYMVLTAKHHDGFANWPSEYTDFSVASSPWRDGHGDVVREFTDACHKHGMAVGLYYSPAEASPTFHTPEEYDDKFIGQISEILDGYGQVDVLWFDGCGSEGHEYDWPRIVKEIRRLQPNVLIFSMADPDFRWVGNEAGLAPMPIWNTVSEVPFSIRTQDKEHVEGGSKWLPAECDCRMREVNWFYSDQDEHTIKSLEELMGLYYMSVGRGCNLLLNIGPDRRGLLPDADAARLLEFGAEIKRRFANPITRLADFERENETRWGCQFPEPALIDHAVIQEDLTRGEHVRRFELKMLTTSGHDPIVLYRGDNIGHKAICRFPLVKARKVWLEILGQDGNVDLREISFFNSCG